MPKPKNPRVTKERLRELFAYDPLRGEVQRRVTVGYNAKAGDIVGSKHSQGSPHSEVYARSSACRYLEKCAMLEVWGCY